MPHRASDDPAGMPMIVRRDEAIDFGLTPDQIRQRVRSGRWRRLASGVYGRSKPDPSANPWETHRLEHLDRTAAALRAHPECVAGYGSAAAILGLPLVSGVPPLVQLLVPEGDWTGIRGGVRYRACHLADGDIVSADVRATTATRTWVDIARTHRLPDALSSGDRALAEGAMNTEDAAWALSQLGSIRGVRLARLALCHLDGRRETPLESWSFAAFVGWGLPLPQPQVDISDAEGLVGRVDFHWSKRRVVGEADGRLKYENVEALYAEKRREDRLRALGLQVIRWGWSDLARGGDQLRARLASALLR